MFTTAPTGTPQVLQMVGHTNVADDVVQSNLKATFKRGYTHLAIGEPFDGPVSIVGAGPSLSSTYQDIVGDIIACNSAHDFLISKGIVPKFCMLWDASPLIAKVFTPHKEVIYLLGSRCHPDVFAKLEGYTVKVWHVLGGEEVEKHLIERNLNEPMLGGGSASVTRAVFLANYIGYRGEMHIFGCDSSFDEKDTHVAGSVVDQNKMKLRVCGKWFLTAPWMAMQAGDFKLLIPILQAQGYKVTVHGTGLIPYTMTFMQNVATPDIKVSLYERLRRKMHGVVLLFLQFYNPQLLGGLNHVG